MRAIKAGIFTAATKSELEKLEAERTRWTQLLQDRSAKVAAMFPRAADRYRELMSELASLSDKNRTKAREQIRTLVGEIRLAPTADGYLEAVLSGRFEGLVLLAFEGKLKNVVAGTRFGHYLTPKLRIPLK